MDYELESEVWTVAQQVMPSEYFREIIANAITSYRRHPGHSVLERLHATDIGIQGVVAILMALYPNDHLLQSDPAAYVSLRAPLRAHLFGELQRYLMFSSHASGAVIDCHFAGDLGL
jgi:hypothetical protein